MPPSSEGMAECMYSRCTAGPRKAKEAAMRLLCASSAPACICSKVGSGTFAGSLGHYTRMLMVPCRRSYGIQARRPFVIA